MTGTRPFRQPVSLMKVAAALALTAAMSAWWTSPAGAQETMGYSAYHDYRIVTVAEGLERPWSMAFLPGGDMLITEKPGRLRIYRDGALLPNPVQGTPEVFTQGQAGLLDVVPHPDFENNRLLYLSYSKPLADGESTTAVIRGRFENDRLTNVEEIFEAVTRGRGHYGSRLAFDADGYLFITVGDRQASPSGDLEAHPAQDLSNHHGVVVRLHDDGRVPEDNPFVGQEGARPEIWTYGHRNPQGLLIHPQTGDVWITEHAPQGGDELNLIRKGANYGWPVIGYGVNYGSGSAIHEGTHREGMEQPHKVWVPSIGTSGLAIYEGDRFPNWRGSILAGGLSGARVTLLALDGTDVVREETLVQGLGRVRDVRIGPDGFIYIAVDHRQGEPTPIVRLEPVPRREVSIGG
jgi:glucose/arabinose dehydrogenase